MGLAIIIFIADEVPSNSNGFKKDINKYVYWSNADVGAHAGSAIVMTEHLNHHLLQSLCYLGRSNISGC